MHRWLAASHAPLVVALEGRSGAGKSRLAISLAAELPAAITPLDDFFAASIPDDQRDHFSIAERHRRLAAREPEPFLSSWHRRWDAVEAFRFTHVRPPHTFDFVLDGTKPAAAGRDSQEA